ncbi:MAG TPA: hypothetical protein VGJ19_02455 [Streptosporangiaceae bacterium]
MDQVALFSDVRPAPPADDDVATVCDRTRDRVAAAFQETPPGRRRRRRFAFGLAGGGVLAAGAATAAVTLLAGNAAPPGGSLRSFVTAAYTVRPGQDGTITVTIKQLQDPAGLQRALAADGVPALVRYVPDRFLSGTYHGTTYSGVSPVCQYFNLPRAASAESKAVGLVTGGGGLFWIRPSAMPKGTVVFIQDSLSKQGNIAGIDLLTSSKLPPCVPVKPPTPQQIISPQAGQPTVSPKGHQLKSVPPGRYSDHESPLPSSPGSLS